MKISRALATALFLPGSLSRVVHKGAGAYEELEQKTHISAFVVKRDGELNVECWEVSTDFTATTSGGTYQSLASSSEIEDVGIVTYSQGSQIWPPTQEDLHADFAALVACFAIVQIGSALVSYASGNAVGGGSTPPILNTDKGNNMFYFNDQRSSQSNYTEILAQEIADEDSPLFISAIGNSPMQMVLLHTPSIKKKRLHKGVCNHAGVNIPIDDDAPIRNSKSRSQSHIDVSLHIQEL